LLGRYPASPLKRGTPLLRADAGIKNGRGERFAPPACRFFPVVPGELLRENFGHAVVHVQDTVIDGDFVGDDGGMLLA
jgi:hypothetical protein